MLKNNLRKIIVCILAITLVALVMKTSFASDNGNSILSQLNSISSDGNIQQIQEGENTNKTQNETSNVNTNLNVTANVNTNANANVPTTTPYTGIDNNFTIVFVAIFVVSAIYAYKKIREYNV